MNYFIRTSISEFISFKLEVDDMTFPSNNQYLIKRLKISQTSILGQKPKELCSFITWEIAKTAGYFLFDHSKYAE